MKCKIYSSLNLVAVMLLVLLVFCLSPNAGAQDPAGETSDNQWREALLRFRAEKDVQFKQFPASPLCRSQRMTLLPGSPETYILKTDTGVKLTHSAEKGCSFSVSWGEEGWSWKPAEPGVECMNAKVPGKKVESGILPTGQYGFKLPGLHMELWIAPERIVMVVYDPRRPEFIEFSHLNYYPPAPLFVVKAQLEKIPALTPVKILTSQNEEKIYYRYAKAKFSLNGKDFALTAFKFTLDETSSDYKILFIPFSDLTSGRATYEVGRFLELEAPEGDVITLDFNRCFNPLCNYSPGFNCPTPPLENHLELAVEAGEKTYGTGHGAASGQ